MNVFLGAIVSAWMTWYFDFGLFGFVGWWIIATISQDPFVIKFKGWNK